MYFVTVTNFELTTRTHMSDTRPRGITCNRHVGKAGQRQTASVQALPAFYSVKPEATVLP